MNHRKKENPEITLRSLREAAGYTQEQLAKELKVGIRTISNWENGNKVPKFDNAISLASKLKVSLKTLAKSMHFDVSETPDDFSEKYPKN
ncbi:MAG: helix-turn-helix transcriptional regulator [Pleurocapsa sp. MO_226.B13]|nr:helix-turn-helix transcriptional regulator [Pleurocapsa sp. MO_226.B13]